jgi:hypothetical protein
LAKAGGSRTTTSKRPTLLAERRQEGEDVRGQEVVGIGVQAVPAEVLPGERDGVGVLVHAEHAGGAPQGGVDAEAAEKLKQLSTLAPRDSRRTSARFSRWSRKKPVFCPRRTSTPKRTPARG